MMDFLKKKEQYQALCNAKVDLITVAVDDIRQVLDGLGLEICQEILEATYADLWDHPTYPPLEFRQINESKLNS
jgi:hypothetical protein